ncbi:MAG: carbon starvation protein A [Acidobacteriota bacterium]|nr:carbon starvation protein A [Acidobacteriota bacterium]MDQ7088669.1 carbon starvation protein A [Acidobacteriota bacterium]
MIASIVLTGVAVLVAGYFIYGRLVEGWLGLDPQRPTPAHTMTDGVDYMPTSPAVLMGHHFSSIAGAGPIVGPVIAAAAFGWLPAVVWIVLGSVLIGGVQDFAALAASLRHGARSVAEIAREEISPFARTLFLVFVWLALVYVIVVFVDLTSATFTHDPGVASSSLMYILMAVALGLLVHRAGVRLSRASAVFVPLVFLAIGAGQALPLPLPLDNPAPAWNLLLLGYCLVASVLPVWLLLQPRDFLSSFLLYACLGGGVLGVIFGGGAMDPEVVPLPAFAGWTDANLGLLFPAMFITIACGACSGFHSIVASGTTAKQLANEAHARPVAYGGMLLEGVLALLSVSAVVLVGAQAAGGMAPTLVFSQGLGRILAALGLPQAMGARFAALAISTFLLTTLDTCTRLARYVLEELLALPRGRKGPALAATLATLALPALLTQITLHLPDGTPAPAWKVIWPVFGATNQLLGALAMLAITIWLRHRGRRHAFVAVPMLFMFGVTLVALAQLAWRYTPLTLVGAIAAALFVLALVLAGEAVRRVLVRVPRSSSASR